LTFVSDGRNINSDLTRLPDGMEEIPMKKPATTNEYGQPLATRLHGSRAEGVSFWLHKSEVYRLSEYETIRYDIYGLPMGARWECSVANWKQFANQMFGVIE
jgi:hypothetical protein